MRCSELLRTVTPTACAA